MIAGSFFRILRKRYCRTDLPVSHFVSAKAEASVSWALDIDTLHRDTILMSDVALDSQRPIRLLGSTLERDFGCGVPAACRVPLSHSSIPALKRRGRPVEGHRTAATPSPPGHKGIACGKPSHHQDAFGEALLAPSQHGRTHRSPRAAASGSTPAQ